MRAAAVSAAAASLFALAFASEWLGPVLGPVALVWVALLVAVLASGHINAIAVVAGAVGALAAGLLLPTSPAAFGAVVVTAAFAERASRVRSGSARAIAVGLAVLGGGLAGTLATAFAAASLPVFAVAMVVAGVLAALPLLVPAEDPLAHALERYARLLPAPARDALRDGAELRRATHDLPVALARRLRTTDAGPGVRGTWDALLRLVEARARLEEARAPESAEGAPKSSAGDVLDALDHRIAEHVAVLRKALVAIGSVRAAEVTVDDAALTSTAQLGESLEEESRALVEVRQQG